MDHNDTISNILNADFSWKPNIDDAVLKIHLDGTKILLQQEWFTDHVSCNNEVIT